MPDSKWYRFTTRDVLGKEYTSEQSFETDTAALGVYDELKKEAENNQEERRLYLMPVKVVRIDVREQVADLTPSSVPVGIDDDVG